MPRVVVQLSRRCNGVTHLGAGTTGRRALRQTTDPLSDYAAVDCNVSISVGLDSFSTGIGASISTGAAALGKTLAGLGIEVSICPNPDSEPYPDHQLDRHCNA